jgi:hypothetical protein
VLLVDAYAAIEERDSEDESSEESIDNLRPKPAMTERSAMTAGTGVCLCVSMCVCVQLTHNNLGIAEYCCLTSFSLNLAATSLCYFLMCRTSPHCASLKRANPLAYTDTHTNTQSYALTHTCMHTHTHVAGHTQGTNSQWHASDKDEDLGIRDKGKVNVHRNIAVSCAFKHSH